MNIRRAGEGFNRKQGQGFVGVRSGLSGETVIMLPVWSNVASVGRMGNLRIRLAADCAAEEPILGSVQYVRYSHYIPFVYEADGTVVELMTVITTTDAAMDILQYLSDACDPRLHLEHHANMTKKN